MNMTVGDFVGITFWLFITMVFVLVVSYVIAFIYNRITWYYNMKHYGEINASLKKCETCKTEISIWAKDCPHCGHHYTDWALKLLLLIISTVLVCMTLITILTLLLGLSVDNSMKNIPEIVNSFVLLIF